MLDSAGRCFLQIKACWLTRIRASNFKINWNAQVDRIFLAKRGQLRFHLNIFKDSEGTDGTDWVPVLLQKMLLNFPRRSPHYRLLSSTLPHPDYAIGSISHTPSSLWYWHRLGSTCTVQQHLQHGPQHSTSMYILDCSLPIGKLNENANIGDVFGKEKNTYFSCDQVAWSCFNVPCFKLCPFFAPSCTLFLLRSWTIGPEYQVLSASLCNQTVFVSNVLPSSICHDKFIVKDLAFQISELFRSHHLLAENGASSSEVSQNLSSHRGIWLMWREVLIRFPRCACGIAISMNQGITIRPSPKGGQTSLHVSVASSHALVLWPFYFVHFGAFGALPWLQDNKHEPPPTLKEVQQRSQHWSLHQSGVLAGFGSDIRWDHSRWFHPQPRTFCLSLNSNSTWDLFHARTLASQGLVLILAACML